MAYIQQCKFCLRRNIGTCNCVIDFGLKLERKMSAWKLLFNRKPFPSEITEALQTEIWKSYMKHSASVRMANDQRRNAQALAKKLVEKEEKRISASSPGNSTISYPWISNAKRLLVSDSIHYQARIVSGPFYLSKLFH